MKSKKEKAFKNTVWDYYKKHGRDLPWRKTRDPYHILVSEVMLQQTHVDRVCQKYPEFLAVFPDIATLAQAPLPRVLSVWQGMGYNRRAKALHEAAHTITCNYDGKIPNDREALLALPGVGPSTAGGILAFAFNEPVIFIETNIRRVFIHHFFSGKARVSDTEIEPLIEQTLDATYPRQWYYALFDYGSSLGKTVPNPNWRSAHYTKQSRFEGSNRQLRSHLLKTLLEKRASEKELLYTAQNLKKSREEMDNALGALEREGFVVKRGKYFILK